MVRKENEIKVSSPSPTQGLHISSINTKQVIDATNNRAQYYADLAKKYRDEAKQHRDNAKYYSEQNSDVTVEYIDSVKAELIRKMDVQDTQLEVKFEQELAQRIPKDVSELNNDVPYVKKDDFDAVVKDLELPSQVDCGGKFLYTDGENTSWKEIPSSFNLFDTILKDHILTYEESKGLALQGTYVYKEAIAGSRYGYPDFYNKVVEEYQNSSDEQVYVKPNITAVGNIVDNKGVLTGFSGNTNYVNIPVTTPSNSFELVIKTQTSSTLSSNSVIQASAQYKGIILRVMSATSTKVWLSSNGTSWDVCSGLETNLDVPTNATVWFKISWDGSIYSFAISTDGNTWTQGATVSNTNPVYWVNALQGLGGCFWESYPWANSSIDLTESYLDIDGERWWSGVDNLEYKKNPNGHLFYDISEKDKADEYFNINGTAWFYGVDIENERVFLPRKSWLDLTAQSKIPVIGNGNGLGLATSTDTSKYYPIAERDSDDSEIFTHTARTSPVAMGTSIGNATGGVANGVAIGVSTNPEFSGLTTDLTSVIAEQTEKYLYICVGNTESTSSVTDVVEVTTTENDTTPLFTGMYFDFTPNNVSWLKGGEQKNSGGVYTFCYNELVNELTTPKYGLKVINEADMIAGVDYSEYWKVNQQAMTFTTPSKISYLPINADTVPVIGNGMTLGLTNGTDNAAMIWASGTALDTKKSLYGSDVATTGQSSSGGITGIIGITTDPAKSGVIADLSDAKSSTAQLYFKVANAVQNLELLDVGEVMEALADKISRQDCKSYVTETYQNGASWYRIYSDGWCEQGGYNDGKANLSTITLLKPFANTDYTIFTGRYVLTTADDAASISYQARNITTTSFQIRQTFATSNGGGVGSGGSYAYKWEAKGYIA